MGKDIPEVIFKYAYPLDNERRRLFREKDLGEYPTEEEAKEEVTRWVEFWADFNRDNRVLKEIIDLTGVVYPHTINAFVIGGGLNPMSTPLILPMKRYPIDGIMEYEERAEIIMHEILHIFVGDEEVTPETDEYWEFVRDEYAEETAKTQHHIIIYALLMRLFDEFLPDNDVDEFVEDDWEDYVRAIEVVREKGAGSVVNEFRNIVGE